MRAASYPRQLVLGICLLNLFVVVFAGGFLYHSAQVRERNAFEAVGNLSLALERDIANTLDKIDWGLQDLVEAYDDRMAHGDWDAPAWSATLARQRQHLPLINVLAATDAAGNMVYGLEPGMPRDINLADRAYFIQLRDHADSDLVISQPIVGRANQTSTLAVARRLNTKDGTFAGVVIASIPLSSFSQLADELKLPPGAAYAIRDPDLRVIVRKPAQKGAGEIGSTAISDAFQAQLRSHPDAGQYYTARGEVDGVARVHAYRLDAQRRFYVNVGFSREEFLSDWWVELKITAGLVALFLALSVLLTRQMKRSWKAQNIHLKAQIQQQNLMQAMVDNAPAIIFMKDCSGKHLLVNQLFCDLVGRSADTVIGKTEHDIFPLLIADTMRANDLAIIQSGKPSKFDETIVQGDGARHYLALKFPIFDEAGAVTAVCGIATDITDRTRQQAQKDAEQMAQRNALVREVHHRIKNNLQGVCGLLRGVGRQHPELQDAITQAVGQVQSVAVIHGLQGMISTDQVRMCELTEAVAKNASTLWSAPIDFTIPDLWEPRLVDPAEAVPLALVLNELIVNALKHRDPALSPVQVALQVGEETGSVRVDITNSGSWTPPAVEGHTGLQLVETLLPRQGAKMRRVLQNNSVCITLEVSHPVVILEGADSL